MSILGTETRSLRLPHWQVQPSPALLGLILPLALLLLWWLASSRYWMPQQILPLPSLVWHTAQQLWHSGGLAQLGISLLLLVKGLLYGVIGGALIGVTMGLSRRAEDLIAPSFYAFAQIPSLAWIPLLIVYLGIGDGLKLFLIFKAVVVPVAVHVQVGVRDVPALLRESAAVLRLPWYLRLWRLTLPAALPALLTGLRLALTAAWMTLIAVELLASSNGIGYLMVWGRQLFQLDLVFVCILIIGLTGWLMDRGIHSLDSLLIRWPRPPLAAHGRRGNTQGWAWWAQQIRRWLIPVLFIGGWSALVNSGRVNPAILPSPAIILHTAWQELLNGSLSAAIGWSLWRSLLGLLLGSSLGIIVGLLLGLWRPLEHLLAPSLAAFRQVALFAWVPLITAWAGIYDFAKVVFIALAAFLPVYLATWRGVANRSKQLDEVASTLRLSFAQRLVRLILPGALPSIFAGLRLALIYAWLGSLGAEYFMNSGIGIGSYMLGAQQKFEMAKVFAGMVVVGLLGALLSALGQRLELSASRWRQAGRSG
ncbi:ABC transporter permease [Pseudomonas sp. 5P_3.1_Bac2]|uniref:ABC transporter permease n=1 Tax=Pseudomonas sp. 5P_3.1_Bac2 TaxID=2971617 RepID=UPI0021C5D8D2|nr:ABC transporter permease [Pseudomonas sp. 5P_3.1_Bac2]MCU1719472.1 ABC transporter permease [Pseudomonas sp. 5P_3.1_Bac2]